MPKVRGQGHKVYLKVILKKNPWNKHSAPYTVHIAIIHMFRAYVMYWNFIPNRRHFWNIGPIMF